MKLSNAHRDDAHRQMLVDVGIDLGRTYGTDHARAFQDEVLIPRRVISRVQAGSIVRIMLGRPSFRGDGVVWQASCLDHQRALHHHFPKNPRMLPGLHGFRLVFSRALHPP